MELTAVELWTRIQEIARPSVPEQSFATWFTSARAVALTSDELQLEAFSRFHVEWLEDKFGPLIESAAERVLGRPCRVTVSCSGEPAGITMPAIELEPRRPTPQAAGPPERAPVQAARPALNERYTFARFVVGVHNQLAHAASRAVADRPAKMYNPLFLYGGVGLGKTHLMHAIGHQIFDGDASYKVAYLTTEQFTNELITSIQEGSMPAFRRRYREVDLLLVDDVHFLEGKERTQEEFFHTFNALYDAQRQIVLTSDRPPKDQPGLESRLISRFEWGLVVDIRPPDFETRMAILRKKADDDGLRIDDEVIDFIALSCTASVRELEGAVIKLLAYSSLTNQEINLALAHTALRGMLGRRGQDGGPVLAPERIRELVARRWRVRADALASKRRTKDVTVPRQVAMYLMKETLGMSLVRIGEQFGGRDHSTVIHSIRKVEEQMQEDPVFRRQVEAALAEIKQPSDGNIHDDTW